MAAALDRLARRVSSNPSFLANVLLHYQVQHAASEAALAADLGCAVAVLTNVRLCGVPRVDHFAADCRAIAERFGLKVEALERVCWPW
jgi:hypothetical protein